MKKLFVLTLALSLSALGFSQELSKDDVKAKFIAMLDGSEAAAEKAINTYGSAEVISNGMIPFGANPEITTVEEGCVWFTLTDTENEEVNVYYICSEGNKIVDFDWGDEDEDDEE